MIWPIFQGMETPLFETRLNQNGRIFLLRIKKWATFFYICAFITCVVDFVNAFIVLKSYRRLSGSYPSIIKVESIASMVFLVVFSFLLVLSGNFFYQFSKQSISAANVQDEVAFNDSLKFLLKHITVSSILFTINFAWVVLVLYVALKIGY